MDDFINKKINGAKYITRLMYYNIITTGSMVSRRLSISSIGLRAASSALTVLTT